MITEGLSWREMLWTRSCSIYCAMRLMAKRRELFTSFCLKLQRMP